MRHSLSTEQIRFLSLHARTKDVPMRWRWIFSGTQLRAFTEGGTTGTISRTALVALVRAGFVMWTGIASVRITDVGMQQLMKVAA